MITMPNWIMNNSHFESLFCVPLCKPLLDLQVCVVLMDDLRRKIISVQLHEAHHIIRTGGNQIHPGFWLEHRCLCEDLGIIVLRGGLSHDLPSTAQRI